MYNRANIDRRLFEKIRNRKNFNPGKLTVIVLCLALELSFEEASELYQSAGYAFSDSYKIDVIGKYFLERKIYDVSRFKDVLYRVGVLKEMGGLWGKRDDWGRRGGFFDGIWPVLGKNWWSNGSLCETPITLNHFYLAF